MKKLSFIVCMLMLLSSCGRYASNGEDLYLNSRNGAKLEVPPPLTSVNISNFYDLPPQNKDAKVSVRPPR